MNVLLLALIPFAALLTEGASRKLKARFENRRGPPITQPFKDLAKLWGKKELDTYNDFFFAKAPVFYFIATVAMFAFLPLAFVSFEYDFIFLVYVTILANAFYMLAGVSSDSPFAIVGSLREMSLMVCYEVTLAMSIFSFMIYSNAFSLASYSPSFAVTVLPFASLALIAAALAESKTHPFDTAEAETEINASMETEYSGKGLFFMQFAKYLKKFFYVVFIPFLTVGTSDIAIYAVSCAFVLVVFSLLQAAAPRYRADQAFKFLFIAMLMAGFDFIRIIGGFV